MNWRRGIWLTLDDKGPQGPLTHWFRFWDTLMDGRKVYFPNALCGKYSLRRHDDHQMAWPFSMPVGTVDADGPRCPQCEEAKKRLVKRR